LFDLLYTVKKETPISLEGKASPKSVKTYNNNSQIGTFQMIIVRTLIDFLIIIIHLLLCLIHFVCELLTLTIEQ
jgi:hypothetical protein